MSPVLLCVLMITLGLAVALVSVVRLKSSINPITYMVGIKFIFLVAVPCLLMYSDDAYFVPVSQESSITVLWLSFIEVAAFCIGFFMIRKSMLSGIKEWIALRDPQPDLGFISIFSLLGISFSLYAFMAVAGGGGLKWITETRGAYYEMRAGVGAFWAGSLWVLIFLFMMLLFKFKAGPGRHTAIKLTMLVFGFLFFTYFWGAKGQMMIIVMLAVIYYDAVINRIKFVKLATFIVIMLALIDVTCRIFSENMSLMTYMSSAYFFSGGYFIDHFYMFGGHTNGSVFLSSFWAYVPRYLVPDKPADVGDNYIFSILFPDTYMQGNTGSMTWFVAYLDFGWTGVAVFSMFQGFFAKLAYDLFWNVGRRGIVAFVFYMFFSITSPFYLMPPVLLVTAGMVYLLFRKPLPRSALSTSPSLFIKNV